MPLQVSPLSPADLAAIIELEQASPHASQKTFIVVYASAVDGRMWCGDCRDAEPFVNKKFEKSEDIVRIVFAGSKEEWRSPSGNPWKEKPYSVTKLPTIIKIQNRKWYRLVEEDVYNQAKLDAFVDE